LEIIGSLIQEIITISIIAMLFAGVYKLFQVATDIREIKESLKNARRPESHFSAAVPFARIASSEADASLDSATSYAENLLRAVNAESRAANEPVETSGPRP
jgi:hypothetical protein